jgi:hypothetical protein
VDPSAGVHEEVLLDDLLDDLGSGWVGQRHLLAQDLPRGFDAFNAGGEPPRPL